MAALEGRVHMHLILGQYYDEDRRQHVYPVENGQTVVTVPEGVTEVFSSQNYNARLQEQFRKIVFPQSLRRVGHHACAGIHALETVELPDNLESIGRHAFERTNIREINFPATLREICSYAFAGAVTQEQQSLFRSDIIFNSQELRIDDHAFYQAQSQRIIGTGVNFVGTQAFARMGNIRRAEFKKRATFEDRCFQFTFPAVFVIGYPETQYVFNGNVFARPRFQTQWVNEMRVVILEEHND